MSGYDQQEWLAGLRKQREERSRGDLPALRVVQAAGQVMNELLTDHDHWNRFIQYLQGFRGDAETRRAEAMRKIALPATTDDEVRKLRSDVLRADAIISTLDLCMQLPSAMLESAQKAQELITKFDEEKPA